MQAGGPEEQERGENEQEVVGKIRRGLNKSRSG